MCDNGTTTEGYIKEKLYILKIDTNPYEDQVMLKVVSKTNSEEKTDCLVGDIRTAEKISEKNKCWLILH